MATQLREFSTVDELLAFASTGRLLLLAVPSDGDETAEGRVASTLGVSARALQETFDSVTALRRFSLSGMYALYPKAVFRAASPPSDTGPSLIIPRTERRARREVGE